MAERFFKKEVQKLYLGEGEEFRGEGILAVTKALLQSGVSYVAGYQGAPISHLMDVLADAQKENVYVQPFVGREGGALTICPFAEWLARRSPDAWVTGPGLLRWRARQ